MEILWRKNIFKMNCFFDSMIQYCMYTYFHLFAVPTHTHTLFYITFNARADTHSRILAICAGACALLLMLLYVLLDVYLKKKIINKASVCCTGIHIGVWCKSSIASVEQKMLT